MLKYYVSSSEGNDNNNGLSKSTPFKTLKKVSEIDARGDVVLNLKRGDVWYETLDTNQNAFNRNSLTIQPYGHGEMPTIRGCFIKTHNSYSLFSDDIYIVDILKCDGSKSNNRDIGFVYNKTIDKAYRQKKNSLSELVNDYDYYVSGDNIYLYLSDDISKYDLYFTHDAIGISNLSYNSEVKGIKIELCGSLGITTTNTINASKNINIHHCFIDLIGGSLNPIGNGIQIFNGCDGVKIHHNKIKRCYDVGVTCQGDGQTWKDVDIFSNIFEENGQSFEIWTSNNNSTVNTGIVNCLFRKNICKNQGRGWSEGITRRNVELLSYGLDLDLCDVKIYENVFFNPKGLYHWNKLDNRWKSFKNKIFMYEDALLEDCLNYSATDFEEFKNDTGKEVDSELILINNSKNKVADLINKQMIEILHSSFKEDIFEELEDEVVRNGIFQFKSNSRNSNRWVKICEVSLDENNSNACYEITLTELEKNTFENCRIIFSSRRVNSNEIYSKIEITNNSSNVLLNSDNIFCLNNKDENKTELWFKYTDIYITISGRYNYLGGIKAPISGDLFICEEYTDENPSL